ncbi:MAG: sulfatase-like hydrolase/transferase [Pirellulales bacterium]
MIRSLGLSRGAIRLYAMPLLLLALGYDGIATAQSTSTPAKTAPNIILVMPDDVGYGDYACLGNPLVRTPAVDAFKTKSLLFTNFHVSPTCADARGVADRAA